MQFQHFSHKHPLTLDEAKKYETMICNGCGVRISGDYYYCNICKPRDYYICRSCFKLTRELQHPFHPHPLALLAKSPYEEESENSPDSRDGSAYCNVCLNTCGFTFHCSTCKFDLDVNCSTLNPITDKKKNYGRRTKVEEVVLEEQQVTHPHPLIPCYRQDKEIDFCCTVCELSIKGTIYACLECGSILDESCAQLPQQITHPFHPHHSLTLKDSLHVRFSLSRSRCKICQTFKGRVRYCCSDCHFRLDVRCASLMPNPLTKICDDTLITHRHALVPCDNTSNGKFSFSCSACSIPMEEGTLVYVCQECRFFLHKSCAELPRMIQHPFHPPHPLQLRDTIIVQSYHCKACGSSDSGFSYWCSECDFVMHVMCASLAYTTLKLVYIHDHPLAFFTGKTHKEGSLTLCSTCKRFVGFPFFRCVPCDFSIRLCCLPILPPTFIHSDHGHSLTYTEECIKHHPDDDSDQEYICDMCEDTRTLQEPSYYCEECPLVAELSCVFDEILEYLRQRELSLAAGLDEKNYESVIAAIDKEILTIVAQLNALIPQAETLDTKMEELQERRVHLCSDSQIGLTEVETKNVSADHKTSLIVKLDEEIATVKAEGEALTEEAFRLNTKLVELVKSAGSCQFGEIPSLGIDTKSYVTILDEYDNVVDEEVIKSKLEELKKKCDEEIEALADLKALKRKSDEEIEALTANLEALEMKRDGEIEALAKLKARKKNRDGEMKALTTKLKALEKKHARCVSVSSSNEEPL